MHIFISNLFVLRFYHPVNSMVMSVYLTTLLLGRLSPLSGKPFCAHSWQLLFLNQWKRENGLIHEVSRNLSVEIVPRTIANFFVTHHPSPLERFFFFFFAFQYMKNETVVKPGCAVDAYFHVLAQKKISSCTIQVQKIYCKRCNITAANTLWSVAFTCGSVQFTIKYKKTLMQSINTPGN